MTKGFFKRLIASILSLVILLSAVNFSTYADFVIGNNSGNQKLFVSYFNSRYDFNGVNGSKIKGSIIKLNKNSATGDIAYCIEVRTHAPSTGSYTTYTGSDWDKYAGLDPDAKMYINYAIMYGYLGTQKYSSRGMTANDERIATQIIIWNIAEGWFDSSTTGVTSGSKESNALNVFTANISSADNATATNIKNCYKYIKYQILKHLTKPSFSGTANLTTRTVSNGSAKYTYSVPDTTGQVACYDWKTAIANAGLSSTLSYSISGSTITFTSTKAVNVKLTAKRTKGVYCSSSFNNKKAIALVSGDFQPAVGFRGEADPVTATITLKSPTPIGNLEITKTWEHHGDPKKDYPNIYSLVSYTTTSNGVKTTFYVQGTQTAAGTYKYKGVTADKASATKFLFASSNTIKINDLPTRSYKVSEYSDEKTEYGSIPFYTRVVSTSTKKVTDGGTVKAPLKNERNIGDLVVVKNWNNNGATSTVTYVSTNDKKITLVKGEAVRFKIYYTDSSGNKHYLKANDGSSVNNGIYAWDGTTTTASEQLFSVYQSFYNGKDGFKVINMPTGYSYFVEEQSVEGYIPEANNISVTITSKVGKSSYTPDVEEVKNNRVKDLTIKKVWKAIDGSTLPLPQLAAYTNQIYFTISNGSDYVVATQNSAGVYTFSKFVTSESKATKFKAYCFSQNDIKFTLNDVPYKAYVAHEYVTANSPVAKEFVATNATINIANTATTGTFTNTQKGSLEIGKTWVHNSDKVKDNDDIYFIVYDKAKSKYITATGENGEYTYSSSDATASTATKFVLNDSNLITISNLKAGEYIVYEKGYGSDGSIPFYSKSDSSILVTVSNGKTSKVKETNTRDIGALQIQKVWEHLSQPDADYSDVYFTVKIKGKEQYVRATATENEGEFVFAGWTTKANATHFTLNSNNLVFLDKLPTNDYTVTEEGRPSDYTAESLSQDITVSLGKTSTVKETNTHDSGTGNVKKVLSDESVLTAEQKKAQYEKIAFTIQRKSDNKYVTATGSNGTYAYTGVASTKQEYSLNTTTGEFSVSGLPVGDYILKETKYDSSKYVQKTASVSFTITKDTTTEVKFENTRLGSIKIQKNWVFTSGSDNSVSAITTLTNNTYFLIKDKTSGKYVTVTGSNGNYTYKALATTGTQLKPIVSTNSSGAIDNIYLLVDKLPLGAYTVYEYTSGNASSYFTADATSKDVTISIATPNATSAFTNTEDGKAVINKTWNDLGTGYANSSEKTGASFYIRRKSDNKYITASGSAGSYTYTGIGTTDITSGTELKLNSAGTKLEVKDIDAGTYIVTEVLKSNSNFTTPSEREITVTKGKVSSFTFTNVVQKGNLNVGKKWVTEGLTLSQAETLTSQVSFKIKFGTKYVVATQTDSDRYTFSGYTTSEASATIFNATAKQSGSSVNATFNVSSLPIGTYTIIETATDEVANRFKADSDTLSVSIVASTTAKTTFSNVERTLEIIKVWENMSIPVTDEMKDQLSFRIKDNTTGKYVIATGSNGDYIFSSLDSSGKGTEFKLTTDTSKITITNMPKGEYTVSEENVPTGYPVHADLTTNVVDGKTTIEKFTNTHDIGKLYVRKYWLSYKELSVAKIQELSDDTHFLVSYDGKYVQATDNGRGVYSYTALVDKENATKFKAFVMLDSDNNFVDNRFHLVNLPTGTYKVEEFTTSSSEAANNYVASFASRDVVVEKSVNNSTSYTFFTNTEKGAGKVTKTFTKTASGSQFTEEQLKLFFGRVWFTIKNGNQYVAVTGENGNYTYQTLTSDERIMTLNSDDGTFIISNMPQGTYTITEYTSDSHYLPENATQTFVVKNGKLSTVSYVNEPQSGCCVISKEFGGSLTTDDKNNLTSYYNDIKFVIKDNATGKFVNATGANGAYSYSSLVAEANRTYFVLGSSHSFSLSFLPEGTYTVIETECSEGFKKAADQVLTITIGATKRIKFTNVREVSSLTIEKDWNDPEEATLSDAQKLEYAKKVYFTIQDSAGDYVHAPKNSSGVYVYSSTSATLSDTGKFTLEDYDSVITVNNLPTGTYTVKEVASTALPFTAESASKEITVTVSNNASVRFTNIRDKGILSINKNWLEGNVTPSEEKQKEYNEKVYFTVQKGDMYVAATGSNGSYNYTKLTSNASEATRFVISTTTPFKCVIHNMPTGEYKVTETCEIENCTVTTPVLVQTVKKNITASITFKNLLDTYIGSVVKHWKFTADLTSSERQEVISTLENNIYFTVKDSSGDYLKATKSDNSYIYDGTTTNIDEAKFNVSCTYDSSSKEYLSSFNMVGLPSDTYTVEEHSTLPNYKSDSTSEELVLTGNTNASVSFTNRQTSIIVTKNFSDESKLTQEQLKAQYKKVTVRFKIIGINGSENTSIVDYGKYLSFTEANGMYNYSSVSASTNTNTDLKLNDTGKFEVNFMNCSPYYLMVEEIYDSTSYVGTTGTNIIDCGTYTDVDYTVDNSNRVDLKNIDTTGKDYVIDDITLNNTLKTGSIYIDKEFLDIDNSVMNIPDEQLTKVTFKAYNSYGQELVFNKDTNGNYNYSKVSENGTEIKLSYDSTNNKYSFLLDKLPANERYTVAEVSGSDYFSFSVDPVTFDITPNGTAKKVFTNKAMTGNVKVIKRSTNKVIEGFEFTLSGTSYTGKEVNITGKTGANGELNFTNLRIGEYTVSETKTGKAVGYITENDKSVVVEFDSDTASPKTTVVEFVNTAYGKVTVYKKDSVSRELLSGATFGIYTDMACTNPAQAYTSDTDKKLVTAVLKEEVANSGIFTCNYLPINSDEGTTYYIKELTAPSYHLLDTEVHEVTVVEAGVNVELTIDNIPYGSVYTKKFDKEDTDSLLTGAIFTLYESDKTTVVDTLTEIRTGEYQLDNIKAGTYYLQETKAPTNYVRDTNFYEVVISEAGKIEKVETVAGNGGVPNSAMKGSIVIQKTSSNNKLDGFSFRVTGTSNTGDAYDETFVTDANGKITIDNLRIGTYTVTEVINNATVGYITESNKTVVVSNNKTSTEDFNNKAFGGFSITKVDSVTDDPVVGAIFGIYTDYECTTPAQRYTSATDKTLINAEFVTDGTSGIYNCSFLPINSEEGTTYYIKELTAPQNYVLDDKVYEFTLVTPNKVVPVTNNSESSKFIEVPYGSVELTKYDADTNKVLSGAEFTIFSQPSATSDIIGKMREVYVDEVPTGVYRYENLEAGTYYLQETKAPAHYVRDTNFYEIVISEAGKTVYITNTPVATSEDGKFIEAPMKGNLKINKVSSDGKVEGYQFRVSGTALNGTPVTTKTYTTDANGEILIEDLLIGTYKVEEVKNDATVGYITPKSQSIVVNYNNTSEVTMRNIPFAHIRIEKVDALTNEKVSGATFGIYTDASCTIPAKAYTSDTDSTLINAVITETALGVYTCNNLPIDSKTGTVYYIKELTAPVGYYLDSQACKVTLSTANDVVAVSNNNSDKFVEYPYGHASIEKSWILHNGNTDEQNASIIEELCESIYFTVQNADGEYVFAATQEDGAYYYTSTGSVEYRFVLTDGKVSIKNIPTGVYKVTEYSLLDDYTIVGNNPVTITVKKNETASAPFKNERDTGSLTVIKEWEHPVQLTDAEIAELETHITFTIKDSEGKYVVAEFDDVTKSYNFKCVQTDSYSYQLVDGKVKINGIPTGLYTVEEHSTLDEYKNDMPVINDDVIKDGDTPYDFTNTRKTGTGKVIKVWTHPASLSSEEINTLEQNITFTIKTAEGSYVTVATTDEDGVYNYAGLQDTPYEFKLTNGVFAINNMPTGTYTATEISDNEDYKNENPVQTFTINDDDTSSVTFDNIRKTGTAEIYKEWVLPTGLSDDEQQELLNELETYVTFTITDSNGKYFKVSNLDDEGKYTFLGVQDEVAEFSLSNGKIAIKEVPTGTYTVTEINKANGYLAEKESDTITVSEDSSSDLTFTNKAIKGKVYVTKVDIDYPDNKLTGAEFTVYAEDKTTVIGKLTEVETGEYELDNLYYGKYYLKETIAPENFVLDEEFHEFNITEDGVTVEVETKAGVGLENNPKEGSLEITKVSADGKLEGWNFRITSISVPTLPEGVVYDETFTTDADGKIYVDLRIGTYKIEEITTGIEGYLFPESEQGEIEWNVTLKKKFENIPYGTIVLNKVDEMDVIQYVSGAVYAVYKDGNENGTYEEQEDPFVANLEEIEDGVYTLEEVVYGKYLVKEMKAPKGYLVDPNYYPINIGEANAEVAVSNATTGEDNTPIFKESPIMGSVEITKVDEEYPDNKLTGAEFTIFAEDKTTEIGKLTEVETGIYRYEGLRYGKYYLQETKAPEYFIRDINFYYFEITENGKTVVITNDELGKGTFINSPEKGELQIVKTSYNNKVDGFTFEVTGTTYTGQTYKEQFVTDKNGIIKITGLRAGEYTVHEVSNEATVGYVLPDDEVLTIEKLGDVVVANMYNGNNPNTGDENNYDKVLPITAFAAMVGTGTLLVVPTLRKRKYRIIRIRKK